MQCEEGIIHARGIHIISPIRLCEMNKRAELCFTTKIKQS
jgi:hypothetical protein